MHGIKQDKHDNNRIDYNFKTEFPDLPAPPSSLITTQNQLLLTAFIFSSSDSYDLTTKKKCVHHFINKHHILFIAPYGSKI